MDIATSVPTAVPMRPIHGGGVRVRIGPAARFRLECALTNESHAESVLYVRLNPSPQLMVIERPKAMPSALGSCDSWGMAIVFDRADEARIDGLRIEFDTRSPEGGFHLVMPDEDRGAQGGLPIDTSCMSCASGPGDHDRGFALPALKAAMQGSEANRANVRRGPALPVVTMSRP